MPRGKQGLVPLQSYLNSDGSYISVTPTPRYVCLFVCPFCVPQQCDGNSTPEELSDMTLSMCTGTPIAKDGMIKLQ